MCRHDDDGYGETFHLLPYTDDLRDEVLYEGVTGDITYLPSPWLKRLSLPKMDINDVTQESLFRVLRAGYNVTFAGNNLGGSNDLNSP